MKKNESGFTLIELLVVVAIIGILAAIAIPQFSEYRRRGFDSRALSDLRNAATGEEAYFADEERYVACSNDACVGALPGFQRSDNVEIAMTISEDANSFEGTSSHPNGTDGKTYRWNSEQGGLQTGEAGGEGD